MSTHTARISWVRGGDDFASDRYRRSHFWHFDGGVQVRASSSPAVVPVPLSCAEAVDPEEAFVAALSSCHMLWFLSIARAAGFVVERYEDDAEGIMARNADGVIAITEVRLRPTTVFAGQSPDAEGLTALHHDAHRQCFLAASVTATITCHPRIG